MLKCDDRFARQNRDGPPPEFPLASPSSSIVHHLSGPIGRAPTRTASKRGRSTTHPLRRARGLSSRSLSLRLLLSSEPRTRAHVRLLGPCFKTGPMRPPSLDSVGVGLRNRSAALLPEERSGERVRPRRGRLPCLGRRRGRARRGRSSADVAMHRSTSDRAGDSGDARVSSDRARGGSMEPHGFTLC